MSFVQGMATQVKRFACDRCHGQKLRCPRPADNNDPNAPCIRCQKAGTVCNISTPLKTGRPSKALKLQARTETRPSIRSPPLSRTSSSDGPETSAHKNKDNTNSAHQRESSASRSQNAASTSSSYPSSVSGASPTKEALQIRDDSSVTPMVMDEYSEFFDFNLDFSDSVTMDGFGKIEEKDIWDYAIPQCPSLEKPKPGDQINFLPHFSSSHAGLARDPLLYDSPTDPHVTALDDSMMVDDSTSYSTPSSTFLSPFESASRQSSCRPETALQDTSFPSEVGNTLEDGRMLFPSPYTNLCPEDNAKLGRQRSLTASRSLTTLRTAEQASAGQTDELRRTQSMLQLQIEIYDCSAIIIHSSSTSETDDESFQNQSAALGKLFCATEKFINLISETCSSQQPTTPQTSALVTPLSARSVGSSNTTTTGEKRPTTLKRGASSPALDGSFGQFMFDAMPSSQCEAAFSSTAAFHLMMACHTRLLTAYDTIINNIGLQLSNASNSGRRPSTASLSIGAFTIESGTFLESHLHLQVISHQLSTLSEALRRALLSSKTRRQQDDFSSKTALRTFYQARRPTTPPTLEESAMELVEEQEVMLQLKIKKIKSLSSEPPSSRRTRTRLDD